MLENWISNKPTGSIVGYTVEPRMSGPRMPGNRVIQTYFAGGDGIISLYLYSMDFSTDLLYSYDYTSIYFWLDEMDSPHYSKVMRA